MESTGEVELTLPFVEAAYAAWSAVPTVSVRAEAGSMIVRLRARDVTLPSFDLAPGAVLDLSLRLGLAGLGSRSVQLAPEFNGAPASGFSCYGYGQPQVPR